MKSHIVINGNAFYEVDEECLKRQKQEIENRKASEENTSGRKDGSTQKNRYR